MMRFICCFLLINISLQANLRTKSLNSVDKAFGALYPYRSLTYTLEMPLQTEVFYNKNPEFQAFAKKYGYLSEDHPIVGKVTNAQEDVLIAIDILKQVHEKIKDPLLRSMAVTEVLSKVLAYRNLKEKMEVPLGDITYEVDIIFDLWHGMPAFGLVPKKGDAPPLLIFRGTDFSFLRGWASITSDFDPKGPGFSVFVSARPKIHEWLKKVGKAKVMGFSLGGTLTAYTALFEKEFVLEAITFNMAGVSLQNQEEWKNLEGRPPLKAYLMQGDFVAKIGHLIGDLEVASFDQSLYPIASHTSLITFAKKFYLSKASD